VPYPPTEGNQKVLVPLRLSVAAKGEQPMSGSSIDWFNIAVWSLIGTWALVVGTLWLMYWQTRQSQHLNSANAVMNLRERFDGTRMRAARRHLADRLLRQAHQDIASVEVATFFELIGTLTHRRLLDDELVWEAFGTWIESYFWALRNPVDLIGQLRANLADPLIFHEFEWLHSRVLELNSRNLPEGAPSARDPGEDARGVLKRETALESI
jgi:hypothetical protein